MNSAREPGRRPQSRPPILGGVGRRRRREKPPPPRRPEARAETTKRRAQVADSNVFRLADQGGWSSRAASVSSRCARATRSAANEEKKARRVRREAAGGAGRSPASAAGLRTSTREPNFQMINPRASLSQVATAERAGAGRRQPLGSRAHNWRAQKMDVVAPPRPRASARASASAAEPRAGCSGQLRGAPRAGHSSIS